MEYAELNLYNKRGGSVKSKQVELTNVNTKENMKNKEKKQENIIKLYKKKIIEQRNEIERLKEMLEKYKK
tara:strand:- start:1978 stop:2187 length:210 start_codon:yes stop_codon:yes gene_type:complete